jgi:hypothetical protein
MFYSKYQRRLIYSCCGIYFMLVLKKIIYKFVLYYIIFFNIILAFFTPSKEQDQFLS